MKTFLPIYSCVFCFVFLTKKIHTNSGVDIFFEKLKRYGQELFVKKKSGINLCSGLGQNSFSTHHRPQAELDRLSQKESRRDNKRT